MLELTLRYSLVLLTALFLPVRGRAAEGEPTAAFASRFYVTLLKQKPLGVPNATQWRALRPFFADGLRAVIEKAQREEAIHTRKHSDEPPVFGDGCLFTSLYEGLTKFSVGQPAAHGQRQHVPIALVYTSGREKTQWTDTLILSPAGKSWRIDDIELGGKWAFKSGSSLRHVFESR